MGNDKTNKSISLENLDKIVGGIGPNALQPQQQAVDAHDETASNESSSRGRTEHPLSGTLKRVDENEAAGTRQQPGASTEIPDSGAARINDLKDLLNSMSVESQAKIQAAAHEFEDATKNLEVANKDCQESAKSFEAATKNYQEARSAWESSPLDEVKRRAFDQANEALTSTKATFDKTQHAVSLAVAHLERAKDGLREFTVEFGQLTNVQYELLTA